MWQGLSGRRFLSKSRPGLGQHGGLQWWRSARSGNWFMLASSTTTRACSRWVASQLTLTMGPGNLISVTSGLCCLVARPASLENVTSGNTTPSPQPEVTFSRLSVDMHREGEALIERKSQFAGGTNRRCAFLSPPSASGRCCHRLSNPTTNTEYLTSIRPAPTPTVSANNGLVTTRTLGAGAHPCRSTPPR